MTFGAALVELLLVGLVVWLILRRRRGALTLTRDQLVQIQELIRKERREIEQRRQQVIDEGERLGKTLSTDRVLKYAEELSASYAAANRKDEQAMVERVIADFRRRYPSEIPVDEAYRIMKELEQESGA